MKITVVGDGFVGKTCILATYVDGKFPEQYEPTVFENLAKDIKLGDQTYPVTLWDTAGQEDYERLRPLSYPNTSCFLLCFSVDSKDSFANVMNKWVPELRYHKKETPIVLVGTKVDLRGDPQKVTTLEKEGRKLARKIGAAAYVECSAKDCVGLDDVFHAAIRAALGKKTKQLCRIL